MKAIELRIGNWYNSIKFNTPIRLQLEDFAEASAHADGSDSLEWFDTHIEPIPLTEQWLKDFGFINGIMELTLEVEGQRLRKIEVNCFDFTNLTDYKEKIFCKLTYSSWNPETQTRELFERKFYYVHQFQNLCFELTGNELTK